MGKVENTADGKILYKGMEFENKQDLNNYMLKQFANLSLIQLRDLTKNTTTNTTFTSYTKETLVEYLQRPSSRAKEIRNASIYMYNISSQYRRLINYYAKLPTWAYTISPSKLDITKANAEKLKKQYIKVVQTVENMQIKHEFQKVMTVLLREDVFFGIVTETKDSFYIHKINPDYCVLSSIEDGVYNFAIDMSQIKEEDLVLYPEIVTTLYNQYKTDRIKYKEVPSDVSACFKANEDLTYPLPIFAGALPALFDIEDYKALMKQRTEVGNYKAMSMKVPLTDDGIPKIDYELAQDYYHLMTSILPDYVGAFLTPMDVESFNFESNNMNDSNEVTKVEEQFWTATGTSYLLFGGGDKTSASALALSVKPDEGIVIAIMNQIERWINKRLKNMSGTYKIRINLLPVTEIKQKDMLALYQTGGKYGLPVKNAMCAVSGLTPSDVLGMSFLENECLNLQDEFIPLNNTHSQSNSDNIEEKSAGRPTNESKGEQLTEAGEQTQNDDENDDKKL